MWLVFCCNNYMHKIYSRFSLLRRMTNIRAAKFSSEAKNDLIVPFQEKPAPGKFSTGEQQQIPAAELFSIFTADIITENRIFVR